MRAVLAAGVVVAALAAGPWAEPQRFDQMKGDELYAAYLTSGPSVLANAFPSKERFEAFRNDFRDHVLTAWEKAAPREPRHAMFMLDIALATEGRHYGYWSDFLLLGQTYLRQRADPPGANQRMDAFELLWNKTALAYLEGRRQPELVEELARRLRTRIVAALPADVTPALVDPWIASTMGFMHEGYVIADAERFKSRATSALESYGEALKYEATRAEAVVRSASVLLRSSRPVDALAMLDRFDESWTQDAVVIYWARLLKGKALDALDRPEESLAAYRRALQIVPSAQTPLVGMMMAESRRGRDDEVEALAVRVRTAGKPVIDPWWSYPHGDLRFYKQRLAALREMVK
jgi:tetratricopeptide (TPR) repeat protein